MLPRSSTIASVSRNAFSPAGAFPARVSTARTKTMSVGIAMPKPGAASVPAVNER
jgi:hypothetical protein